MIGCLPTKALAFLAVFVYATHATQAIAFEWKPGLMVTLRVVVVVERRPWSYNGSNSPIHSDSDYASRATYDADGIQCARLLAV